MIFSWKKTTFELDSLIENNKVFLLWYSIRNEYCQDPSFPIVSYFHFQNQIHPDFFSKFLSALEVIASEGDPTDIFFLGLIFLYGFGIASNPIKAFSLFQQGSKMNHSSSIFFSGYCYQKGYGIPKDFSEALRLYQLAVELKNPIAMVYLADLYYDGIKLKQDIQEAINLYSRAIDL
jgi:tetratricopeptide (TPR) repeat protein